ncbi:PAQR family membrane homeostasis protein TrhA [Endozoicomonas euniceicola]|uniref:Hemolysin III family protein n=1 Tax=Endozoicomonas euniceicola TaxID=1234143 RepID=A0ABY6GX45_9GAMM|nr:hemolysin III family protein [Endozoicomonas euniceicola]UYM17345.1 hemolysin III family protein [Endozoicomonas euniceicola]
MKCHPSQKPPMLNRAYSLGEEIANSVTHGIGAMLSVAGLTLLVTYAAIQGDTWRVVSFSIYGGSMILLFLMSTLYHSFQNKKVKQVFKLLDHCAIYLLIAGTYTPFLLVTLRGTTGWILFAIIWLLAFTGIIFKLAFRHRFKKLSLLTYVAMGWLALFVGQELTQRLSAGGMAWLIAGGLAYTLGVIFYVWKKLPYNHAIWHLFVLAGSLCHYTTIFVYVLPDS